MLANAEQIAGQFSGVADVWQTPFANPNAVAAITASSVWFTACPMSTIAKPGHSFLGTLADENLGRAFQAIDGYFDRIGTEIDEVFGTDQEFRRMCEVAAGHGGIVIDDTVPGHTGKGPDFRLAEMKVGDYPGIYHMVEIPPEDWRPLPDVSPRPGLDQPRRGRRAPPRTSRLHRRPAATRNLPGTRRQGHQLERDRTGHRRGRNRAALGLPALLQRRSTLDQLARPDVRRYAPRRRRRAAFAGPPRCGGPAPGRQRLPRRGEKHHGRRTGPVRRASAVRGGQPGHREHGPQGGRVHLSGTQSIDRRHSENVTTRAGPFLRLRQPAGVRPRHRHRRHQSSYGSR